MDALPKIVGVVALCVIGGCFLLFAAARGGLPGPYVGDGPAFRGSEGDTSQREPATLAEFDRLAEGMSYREACAIICGTGERVGDVTFQRGPSDTSTIMTVTYTWRGRELSHMSATFRDDRLISKTQFGLD